LESGPGLPVVEEDGVIVRGDGTEKERVGSLYTVHVYLEQVCSYHVYNVDAQTRRATVPFAGYFTSRGLV